MEDLPRVIVLKVPESWDAEEWLKEIKGALVAEDMCCTADSARLVDLAAMHMHPAPGKTYSDLESGYNEALREIAGLERNSETSEG